MLVDRLSDVFLRFPLCLSRYSPEGRPLLCAYLALIGNGTLLCAVDFTENLGL